MNDRLHELVFILNESSSISEKLVGASESLKNLFKEQETEGYQTNVTLTIFSDGFQSVYDNLPIEKAKLAEEKISSSSICPLIDSVDKTMYDVGVRLNNTAEQDRPSKVIVVIVAFGTDNASKKHTYDQLREYISIQTNIYKWKFYLATDFSRNMEKLGIPEDDTFIFKHDDEDMFGNVYRELSAKILDYRFPKPETENEEKSGTAMEVDS